MYLSFVGKFQQETDFGRPLVLLILVLLQGASDGDCNERAGETELEDGAA